MATGKVLGGNPIRSIPSTELSTAAVNAPAVAKSLLRATSFGELLSDSAFARSKCLQREQRQLLSLYVATLFANLCPFDTTSESLRKT
jgi:hypothetical protein